VTATAAPSGPTSAPQVGGPDGGSRDLRAAFSALQIPVFRWWFAGQVLSGSGNMTQGVASAWLVLRLSGSGVALGGVTACMFAPLLFGGVWAGVLVDRFDRRRVLALTQTCFLVISAALGALTAFGLIELWMVFAGALLGGCVNAVDQPARQVYVLDLVGRERTANAISLNEVVINASRILGPAAGGALLATTGVAGCFLFNAGTFVLPLAVLWRFRPAEHVATRPRRRGAAREGLRYAWGQPAIRGSLLMAAASGMLFNLGVALPLVATRVFHLGGSGYALMMGAFGVGAVCGALFAATGSSFPSGRSVRLLAVASGIVVIATAASPDIGAELAGLALCGFSSIWFIARANTFVQLLAPPPMRGRVMGAWTMALPGANPLTALLAGLVAQEFGAREGFALAGVALILTAGIAWRALADTRPTAACPAEV
jgi:MFS family permease